MSEPTDKDMDEIVASSRLINDKMTESDSFVEGVIDEMVRLGSPEGIQDIDVTAKP